MYSGRDGCITVRKDKIRIECVIVCVNYSDFLAQTLPNNKRYLERIVVVTDTKDILTKELCNHHGVDCIQTDVFYENGEKFNKGKGINAGLKHLYATSELHEDTWILHLDSDIWLSPHIRVVLNCRHLDRHAIYGIDRLMCHGWDSWVAFLKNPRAINELYYLVQPHAFPVGSRVAHYNQYDGWFPIGFFQLWNPKTSGVYWYPTQSPNADHTDVLHSKQFPVGSRHLIAETYVIHIDSEKGGAMGRNWKGRKSKWFGPEDGQIVEDLQQSVEEIDEPIKNKGIIAWLMWFILALLSLLKC